MYGLLNIAISPKKADNTSNGEYVKFDYNNSLNIWLSYNHAYILANEMRRLIQTNDPKKLRCVGVATRNDTFINFGFGNEYGTENFVLSILKLNSDGSIQNSYVYEFSDKGYASIVNFDPNTKKFDKRTIANLEVEMFLTLLDEYVKSVNGASAYMNRYYNRFESSRKYDMLAGLCEKLGVDTGAKPNYSNNRGGGFFNGNGSYNQNEDSSAMNPPTGNNFRESTLDDMSGEYDIE